jgi:hypothetical protein
MNKQRGIRCGPFLFLWLGLLAICPSLAGMTLRDFTLDNLVAYARTCVRGHVVAIETVDPVTVRYTLAVNEVAFGEAQKQLTFELDQSDPGMPRLRKGAEYLVFLNLNNRYEKVIGFRWATFTVREGNLFDYDGAPLHANDRRISSRYPELNAIGAQPGGRLITYSGLAQRVLAVQSRLRSNGVSLQSDR